MKNLLVLLLLAGCASTKIDGSPEATASGDLSLLGALSGGACKALPVGGADVCRVKAGTKVESEWRLIVPKGHEISAGLVTVYWKDMVRTYPATGPVVVIPLKDLVGDTWRSEHTDVATAVAEMEYLDSDGIRRKFAAEGMAIIVVTAQDYDPLPLDSGQAQWGFKCRVEYSSSGRSALECK